MSYSSSAATRRSFLVRGLGLCAGLAAARSLGGTPDAGAEKKGKKKLTKVQIALRAQEYADDCAALGGVAETTAKPGGVTVSCTSTGRTCTFYSRGVRCHAGAVNPGTLPDLQTQHPWSDPGHTPDVPLESTEPTLRSARSRRR